MSIIYPPWKTPWTAPENGWLEYDGIRLFPFEIWLVSGVFWLVSGSVVIWILSLKVGWFSSFREFLGQFWTLAACRHLQRSNTHKLGSKCQIPGPVIHPPMPQPQFWHQVGRELKWLFYVHFGGKVPQSHHPTLSLSLSLFMVCCFLLSCCLACSATGW